TLHVEQAGQTERHTPEPSPGNGHWREWVIGDVRDSAGNARLRDLRLIVTPDLTALSACGDGWGMRDVSFLVENPRCAEQPSDAPAVFFTGPLTIRPTLSWRGGAWTVMAQVGTPGVGEGAFACITSTVARHVLARPVATVELPREGGGFHREC